MSYQNRRNFLQVTGGVIGIGTLLSSRSVAATGSTQDELPPLRGPYADENWVEYRSGPGHNGVVEAGPDVDPEDPGCRLFYDGTFLGEPVLADGAMYLADGDGRIVALDAQNGSEEWVSDDVSAGPRPSVGYDQVVTTGDNSVLALDVEDGSLNWETEFDADATEPTVAYETVFVVVDGGVYAVDVNDGSIRWERTDEIFAEQPAVSDGRLYVTVENDDTAGNHDLVALDVRNGEEIWRTHRQYNVGENIIASANRVSISYGYDDKSVFDAESGEFRDRANGFGTEALGDEILSVTDDYYLNTRFFDDRDSWEFYGGSLSLSEPTIAGDTIYVYFGDTDDEDRKQYQYSLLALDKTDGTVTWTCETQAVDEPLFDVDIITTRKAVYVVGDEEIHVIHEDDSNEDDSNGDDSNEDDSKEDCGCDDSGSSDDGNSSDDGEDGNSSDDGEDGNSSDDGEDGNSSDDGEASQSTEEDYQPVGNGTSSEETEGDGPGLGVVSAVTSLGGIGYVLQRRLGKGQSNAGEKQQ